MRWLAYWWTPEAFLFMKVSSIRVRTLLFLQVSHGSGALIPSI